MAFKIWILLFASFIIYSGFVYINCDEKQHGVSANKHVYAGWKTWQQKNCQSCHQFYGLGGYLGPDLTNIASDSTKKGGYMYAIIKYGTGRMPNFHLNDTEIADVIEFLTWVDKSGKSRVSEKSVNWTGTYNLDN
jgi:nitric oxide reductase subunit C